MNALPKGFACRIWPLLPCIAILTASQTATAQFWKPVTNAGRLLQQWMGRGGTAVPAAAPAAVQASVSSIDQLIAAGQSVRAADELVQLSKRYSPYSRESTELAALARDVRWLEPALLQADNVSFAVEGAVTQREALTLQLLEATPLGQQRLRVVKNASVRTFSRQYAEGYNDTEAASQFLREYDQELAARWQATTGLRFAIIGSGKDEAYVNAIRAKVRAQGGEVFFYKFCEEIRGVRCDNRAVGAFMATADQILFLDSANAASSPYVGAEIATAKSLIDGRPMPIMLTRTEIALAAGVSLPTAGWSVLYLSGTRRA